MKYKCGIGLFIFLFVLIYFITYGAYHEYKNTHNVKYESNTDVDSIEENHLKNGYFLYEINGYVVVYKTDKTTPYEYTDIKYEDLPELLKSEIKNGKYINTEEELYGFLENYTS